MLWFDRHRRLRDQLSAYIDGELGDAAIGRLEAHLADCVGCRADLQELRAAVDALRELPQAEAPRSFVLTPERVAGPRPAIATPPLAIGLRLATAAVAAALAVVVVVDVGDFGGGGTTDERSIQTAFTEEAADRDADMIAPTAGELGEEPPAGGVADDDEAAAAPDALREPEDGEQPAEPPAERSGADVPPDVMESEPALAEADDGFDSIVAAEIGLAVSLGLLVVGSLTLAFAGRKR